MSDPQTPPPPTTPTPYRNGTENLPWFLRFFANPAMLANVVAFGAAVLLLYTAAVEWPRRVDRFAELMQDQRDAVREQAALVRENQRLLLRIETLEATQQTQIQNIHKVLTEMWFKLLAWERGGKGKGEDDPPPP